MPERVSCRVVNTCTTTEGASWLHRSLIHLLQHRTHGTEIVPEATPLTPYDAASPTLYPSTANSTDTPTTISIKEGIFFLRKPMDSLSPSHRSRRLMWSEKEGSTTSSQLMLLSAWFLLDWHSCKYHAASERIVAGGFPLVRCCLGGWQVLCSLLIVDDAETTQEVLRLTSAYQSERPVFCKSGGKHFKKACVQPRLGAVRIPP